MAKKTSDHKALIRRYLLWAFKTTKESFERIERKSTQLIVDHYIWEHLQAHKPVPSTEAYDNLIKEFEAYMNTKRADELKLKFVDGSEKSLHPQYQYLKNRLAAIEAAIKHFLGEKEWRRIHSLYEKEFTTRILQARDH